MEDVIRRALGNPPDYSDIFSVHIEQLGNKIASELNLPIVHESDMNYSAAHRLICYFDSKNNPIDEQGHLEAIYQIIIFISSRANVFTMLSMQAKSLSSLPLPDNKSVWQQVILTELPLVIQQYWTDLAASIVANGYRYVSYDSLQEIVEGFLTDLDNKPATLFEVLFSELY